MHFYSGAPTNFLSGVDTRAGRRRDARPIASRSCVPPHSAGPRDRARPAAAARSVQTARPSERATHSAPTANQKRLLHSPTVSLRSNTDPSDITPHGRKLNCSTKPGRIVLTGCPAGPLCHLGRGRFAVRGTMRQRASSPHLYRAADSIVWNGAHTSGRPSTSATVAPAAAAIER